MHQKMLPGSKWNHRSSLKRSKCCCLTQTCNFSQTHFSSCCHSLPNITTFFILILNSGNALIFILNAKLEFQHVILWGSHVGSHRLCSIFTHGARTSSMKYNASRHATHAMKSIDIVVITCRLYDIRVILSLYPLHTFIIPALYFHYIRSSFPQYLF